MDEAAVRALVREEIKSALDVQREFFYAALEREADEAKLPEVEAALCRVMTALLKAKKEEEEASCPPKT